MADTPWLGCLALAPGWALFVGSSAATDRHAHHAVQIGLAADATLAWSLGDRLLEGPALAVGSDVAHAVSRGAERTAHLYLDPDSEKGRPLDACVRAGHAGAAGPAEAARRILAGLGSDPDWAAMEQLREATLAIFLDPAAPRPPEIDERIERTLARMRESGAGARELARAEGLSQSRLSHLFRHETGVSLRTYGLWWKLRLAVGALRDRASLTDAALHAGFADSAHLSRTFRRMFGVPPSEAIGRLRILLAPDEPG